MLGVIYIFFRSFLKVLNVILEIIEAIMYFLGVIEGFFSPQSLIFLDQSKLISISFI